jgi:hypothetical protein
MSAQSEMKRFGDFDTVALKQHFGKKIVELEDEKKAVQVNRAFEICVVLLRKPIFTLLFSPVLLLQQERDRLFAEVENLAASSDGQTQKLQDIHAQKLKTLEAQVKIFSLFLFSFSFLICSNGSSFRRYSSTRHN